jgi:F-type H+-transporting ATPase subunit epsilon
MHVELVSPERILFSGEAKMVTCRTTEGDVAFLTDHAPFLGLLVGWEVVIDLDEGDVVKAAVHGGFVEVSDNHVIILSDLAEMADDIDVDRARALEEWAKARLAEEESDAECEAVLRRAHVRLALAGERP